MFDYADTIPGSLLPQIKSQAADRYSKKVMNSTYYIFLNTQDEAVLEPAGTRGGDHRARPERDEPARLGHADPRLLLPAAGHGRTSDGAVPVRRPGSGGDIAKAKQLVQQSGMAGTPVTVWSETRSPRQQWMTYYTQFLNQIGFKATQKVIADATYFTTIGNLKLNPQTGFADWNQDFPNPIDFYLLLQGTAIQPTNNQNFGQVKDPHIDSQSTQLGKVPTSQLKLDREPVAGARRVRRQEGVRRRRSATRPSRRSRRTGST